MNDSQSSDVFSISGEFVDDKDAMDTASYKSLLSSTKTCLSKKIIKEVERPTFCNYFADLLNDCESCVSQSLDLAVNLLNTVECDLTKLCEYLEDAVCVLQMLSSFIKNVVESISMCCSEMKTFPTTTGRIIMIVYSHCRDSESLYGGYLKAIEKQLKDFFRSCHELQLTYLMVLEKHFTFDLCEPNELHVLIEVLDINLKIGEIVQTLDVKTMAEQWKAYMMICEKYSHYLLERRVYYDCTKLLCRMIDSNVKNAVQAYKEEKVVLRSLKVASFTLKILLKIIIIFKHAIVKEYSHIVDLLIFFCKQEENTSDKSSQFINLFKTNISVPMEAVIKEAVKDAPFIYSLTGVMNSLETENQLGHICLLMKSIKALLEHDEQFRIPKTNIIDAVFKFLPYGHIWFNTGPKYPVNFQDPDMQTYGLYDRLLTCTLALAMTLDSEEIVELEQKMYNTLLGTDCISALFASNLWVLLARLCPQHYLLSQVMCLCKIYQKLDKNKFFKRLPQSTHLSSTLNKLFEALSEQNKMKVYKHFHVNEERNTKILTVLKINSLPISIRYSAQEIVFERTKTKFNKFFATDVNNADDVNDLIDIMKLASTCDGLLEEVTMKAWSRICPNNRIFILSTEVDKSTVWFLDFLEALVAMTKEELLGNNLNFIKILHIIASLTEKDNIELKLLLADFACKLSTYEVLDKNRHLTESLIKETFNNLLKNSNKIVRNRVLVTLRKCIPNTNMNIINKIISGDAALESIWKSSKNTTSNKDSKENLRKMFAYDFIHKCLPNEKRDHEEIFISDSSVSIVEKTSGTNFDFADIDTLFENEEDSEPANKKVKLNDTKAEEVITRLETDVMLLSNMKENVSAQEKCRIRNICDQLRNIVE